MNYYFSRDGEPVCHEPVCSLKSFKLFRLNRMKRILKIATFLFFMLFISGKLVSEPSMISFQVSEKMNQNEIIFDSLIRLSRSVLYAHPDSASKTARFVLEKAGAQESTLWRIRALNILGIIHDVQSEYDSALYYYFKALSFAVEIEDYEQIANCSNNIGLTHWHTGNYKEALNYLFQALDSYEKAKELTPRPSIHNNIGLIYAGLNQFSRAAEYYYKAYKSSSHLNDFARMGAALTNTGLLHLNLKDYDSAHYYLDKSILIKQAIDDFYGLCISYECKARIFMEQDNYHKSIEFFQNSMMLSETVGYQFGKARTYLGFAQLYLNESKYNKALEMTIQAMAISVKINNDKLIYQSHELLAKTYKAFGDYKKAYEHFVKSVELKNESINHNNLHQIYNLEMEYAANKSLNEIQQLSKEKEIQQLQIEKQRLMLSRKNATMLFIIIALALIFLGVYLFYRNYHHRQHAKLQNTILILTEKRSRAAVEAELRERKRIGQELHDGLGQLLSVARLNLSVLKSKNSLSENKRQELISAALGSVDKTFAELRNISHNLAPSILSEKGLAGALKDIAVQINQSNQIHVNLEIFGINGAFDDLIENTIYRAVQELLNNIILHAKATVVTLQVIKGKNEITLMLEDNGKGFDPKEVSSFSEGGLNNIRSRVENLQGTFYIDAMKGRGTIATILIPINQK
jgi:two-component system, NarL family, sensor kinase